MDDVTKTLAFKSEEEKVAALAEIPDEPPKGVDIEEWQAEQEEKEKQILDAPISEEAASVVPPKEPEEDPAVTQKEPVAQPAGGEEEYIDFSQIGKIKKEDLPENLRNYSSATEILKQAGHARRYANSAEEKLHTYEERIAELETTAKSVPELQKQLSELKTVSREAKSSLDNQPAISTKRRSELNQKLDSINDQIAKLSTYEGEDATVLRDAITSTVGAFKDTFGELDSVRDEFSRYRNDAEKRYKHLEESIDSVSKTSKQADARRKADHEQRVA